MKVSTGEERVKEVQDVQTNVLLFKFDLRLVSYSALRKIEAVETIQKICPINNKRIGKQAHPIINSLHEPKRRNKLSYKI